jgi:hypothetical protein
MVATGTVSFLLVGKIFAIIGLSIYTIFALVVIKQVNLMIETIDIGFNGFIRFIAWSSCLCTFVLVARFDL